MDFANVGIAQAKSDRPNAFDGAGHVAEFAQQVANRALAIANRIVGEAPATITNAVGTNSIGLNARSSSLVWDLERANTSARDALDEIDAELGRIERALP